MPQVSPPYLYINSLSVIKNLIYPEVLSIYILIGINLQVIYNRFRLFMRYK